VNLRSIVDGVRDHPVVVVGALAMVLALLCVALIARVERLKDRLHVAKAAAEDSAKAAALAAPGGIDPDVVADLLRVGERPTLDIVYDQMQQRARGRGR
jgi:hypothetical protein